MRLALLITLAGAALAQTPAPEPVVSPEVHADRSATFRIRAPKAQAVTFYGDWMPTGTSQPMEKDAKGVWWIKVGPLPPSIYLYTFTVDGVIMADPINPRVKLRSRTSASMVEIPGESPAFWQARNVPHGAVELNWHHSKVLGGALRTVWVYTPPGYQGGSGKYPVLYLMHGHNGTAADWVMTGNGNFILDNAIADRRAVPMIVVMPYAHAVPIDAPAEQLAQNVALFQRYLVEEVVPMVEGKYRVEAKAGSRAIAGLSMGGAESLQTGLSKMDLFSYVGIFSAGMPKEFAFPEGAAANEKLRLLWIGCGRQDGVFPSAKRLSEALNAKKIRHTFLASEGAHTFTVWRLYLNEFAPLLFR